MKHRGSGAKPAEKPRLVPHGRSPLAFLIECIRVREWELTTFPAWADPGTVRTVLHDNLGPHDGEPFATGIAERHARRHEAMLTETRAAVGSDLASLAPDAVVPDALVDHWATQRFALERVQAALRAQGRTPTGNLDVAERAAARRRSCKAFAGIYVTVGKGSLSRTAEIVRKHTPAKDDRQTAQHWHARDALGAIAREIGRPTNAAALDRLVKSAIDVRDLAMRGIHAWNRLQAMPGYRRELNHEQLIVEALKRGLLGAWLDETPRIGPGHPSLGVNAAIQRLADFMFAYHKLVASGDRRRRSDVSRPEKTTRNAIAPAAS